MWTAIVNALAAILPPLLKLFGGGGNADQRELGRAEQQNGDMKAGEAVIVKANEAAKKAEEAGDVDPNDRDNRV